MLHSTLRYLLRVSSPRRTRLEWWDLGEIGLAGLGFLMYFLVRGAVIDRTGEALSNARWIVELQAGLGLWIEPRLQTWVLQYELLMRAMNFVYFWMDFPLLIAVALLLFWRRRVHYTLLRDAVLLSGGIALIAYWAFPVAPPRFLTEWGFVDTLELYSNASYQAQSMQPFVNPFAAVPSLHVGWAALVVVAVFAATRNPLLRAGAIASFALQSFSVMATANHYLFDGAAGLAVCAAGLALALAMQRRGYPGIRSVIRRLERSVVARVERESAAPPL